MSPIVIFKAMLEKVNFPTTRKTKSAEKKTAYRDLWKINHRKTASQGDEYKKTTDRFLLVRFVYHILDVSVWQQQKYLHRKIWHWYMTTDNNLFWIGWLGIIFGYRYFIFFLSL